MILDLRFVSYFKAPNGANFDLLADDQLKNFFIKLKQLWAAVSSTKTLEHFKKDFKQTFLADVRAGGTYETFEVVALDDVKDFLNANYQFSKKRVFPYDIFEVIKTPIPKRAEEVYNVKVIYHTGEADPKDRIYIYNDGKRNLVSVFDLSRFATRQQIPLSKQVVKAALCFDLFHDKKTDNYFINLRDVRSFLGYVDGSDNLLKRFQFQVFMSPTPAVSTILNLNCKLFATVNNFFSATPFKIYKGVGFAENAFFFKPGDLAEIIGLDTDDENALDETVFATGELWDGATRYCRLDFAPYIVRHCLARLWNGSNQDHPIIKTGWDLIHWFKDFLPNFYNQHAFTPCKEQFTRGARWLVDSLGCVDKDWELVDTPKLDTSLKEFFDSFDRACRNFKSQLLEAQS